MTQQVGLIGLGLMGSALADALLAKRVDLTVWNRSREKCVPLSEQGAGVANTVEDLVAACDVLLVCLADHAASIEVLEPLADRLSGKVLVSLTTVAADEALANAAWAGKHGIAYLQGAILGYPQGIRDTGCMTVYSGSQQVYENCRVVLEPLGGMPRWLGDRASIAACFDKAMYAAYYAHAVGLIHATALCEAAGAPLEIWREAMTGGSWDWKAHDADLLERISRRDYSIQGASMNIHAAAGTGPIPSLSDSLGISSELPRAIDSYLARALQRGLEDCDLPALIEVMKNDT